MPQRASTSLGSPKHLSRFIRQKSGKTIEEIAAEDGVSIEVVKTSIRNVEFKQGYHTNEYLQQNLIGVVLKLAPAAQSALLEALASGTNREATNAEGEKITIFEPDHDTRLKAVAEVRQIAAVASPRAGHQTNVKVGVGVGLVGGGQASGSYVGMEERMREIRQARRDHPALPEATVKTVDIIDGDPGDDDEDEE
jgi:hypothetical protein